MNAPVLLNNNSQTISVSSPKTLKSSAVSLMNYPWFRIIVRVIIVTWIAATLAFLVLHFTPGTYADLLIEDKAQFTISPERKAEIVAFYGFDKPFWHQYLLYIGGVFKGDLGISYTQNQPVLNVIAEQLLPTLGLASIAIVSAVFIALAITFLTINNRSGGRFISSLFEILAISTPSFWLGILLLTLFSFSLQLFPSSGADSWSSLVLPSLTLAIPMAGTFVQVLRPEFEREIAAPYFLTARARGRSFYSVLFRHALPHAFLPLLTLSGTYFAYLISGSVIVENLFSRPGIGRITLNAVISKDVPLVGGVVILSAAAFVLVNLAIDLLIRRIDPRIGQHR